MNQILAGTLVILLGALVIGVVKLVSGFNTLKTETKLMFSNVELTSKKSAEKLEAIEKTMAAHQVRHIIPEDLRDLKQEIRETVNRVEVSTKADILEIKTQIKESFRNARDFAAKDKEDK